MGMAPNMRAGAQPMMAKSFMALESVQPVEGDEKSVTATVSVKIRF